MASRQGAFALPAWYFASSGGNHAPITAIQSTRCLTCPRLRRRCLRFLTEHGILDLRQGILTQHSRGVRSNLASRKNSRFFRNMIVSAEQRSDMFAAWLPVLFWRRALFWWPATETCGASAVIAGHQEFWAGEARANLSIFRPSFRLKHVDMSGCLVKTRVLNISMMSPQCTVARAKPLRGPWEETRSHGS